MLLNELQRDFRAALKCVRDVGAVRRPDHSEPCVHSGAVAARDFGSGPRRRQTAITLRACGDQASLLEPAAKNRMVGRCIAAVVSHPGPKKAGAHEDFLGQKLPVFELLDQTVQRAHARAITAVVKAGGVEQDRTDSSGARADDVHVVEIADVDG